MKYKKNASIVLSPWEILSTFRLILKKTSSVRPGQLNSESLKSTPETRADAKKREVSPSGRMEEGTLSISKYALSNSQISRTK